MNKIIGLFSLMTVLFALGGCREEGDRRVHHEEYVPELRRFDMIDSYDVDTATSNAALRLSPYLYDGLFEVFWTVNSLEDYRVSFKINDRDTLTNSISIGSTICGAGLTCDQSGHWVCEYTSDFYMNCDTSVRDVDISSLFNTVPKNLFMLLEVCDTNSNYCEFDSYPVTME